MLELCALALIVLWHRRSRHGGLMGRWSERSPSAAGKWPHRFGLRHVPGGDGARRRSVAAWSREDGSVP